MPENSRKPVLHEPTVENIGEALDWGLADLADELNFTASYLARLAARIQQSGREANVNSLGEMQMAASINAKCGQIAAYQKVYWSLVKGRERL